MQRKLKLGICYWYDSQYVNREAPPELPLMESIGYITILRDRVVVIHLKTPDDDISNMVHTTIPKSSVKCILYLMRKDGKRL